MSKELIIIKQLPIIEEQLKELSAEIDKKVKDAKGLVCTEDTVKEVKQVRADLNKEFKEVEQQRKNVKEQVLAPYIKFEEIYKTYISDKYKSADSNLKLKIDTIENELKKAKKKEVYEYFYEYRNSLNFDFVDYERANINVTLTATMKSLKEQVRLFLDKISDDLNLIETQENKVEILVEYKKTLNVSNAIATIKNRYKAIEEEKKQEEIVNQRMEEEKQKVQEAIKPFEEVSTNYVEKIVEISENEDFVFAPEKKERKVTFNVTDEEFEKIEKYCQMLSIEYDLEVF